MKKSSGKYIIDATKKGFSYYIHHLSKFFVFWVIEIASLIAKLTIFLNPVFEKFHIQICKMIDDCGETNISKAFDQSDNKKGYRNSLLFNLVWLLITIAGVAAILGLAFLISKIIYFINYYFHTVNNPLSGNELAGVETLCTLIFIPFYVFAFIFLVFALLIKEIGVYVSYKNSELGLSDVLFNSFATLKSCGGRLFVVNLLMTLEVLTYAAVIFFPIFIVSALSSSIDASDPYHAMYIIWIMIPIFSAITIFVLPLLTTVYRLAIHSFLIDNVKCDSVIIAYRKHENKENENDFIPLTEEKNIDGETIYVEMKKNKKNMKEENL